MEMSSRYQVARVPKHLVAIIFFCILGMANSYLNKMIYDSVFCIFLFIINFTDMST